VVGVEPALGLIAVTLWTMAVATGMVAVLRLAAAVTLAQLSAPCRRPARLDVAQGTPLCGRHARSEAVPIRGAARADDVRDLEHRTLVSTRGRPSSD